MTTDTLATLSDAAALIAGTLDQPVEIRPEPEAAPAADDLLEVRLAPSASWGPATLWIPAEGAADLGDLPAEEAARSIALAVEQAFAASAGTTPRTVAEVAAASEISPDAVAFEIVAGDLVIPAAWDPGSPRPAPAPAGGLGRLADVPLDVVVEIGRTKLPIRELLALDEGGVVRLSRTVGEPVDLLVNGTPAARGDIVVVDGRLGIRVTEILDT